MIYFVPGGRLGFEAPEILRQSFDSWVLISGDETLKIGVSETMPLASSADEYTWNRDANSERVATGQSVPGFSLRRFHDKRFAPDKNQSNESLVLRSAEWMGELQVLTGLAAGARDDPAGQFARWRDVRERVFASVRVRPALPVSQALDELRIGIDTANLHPRMIGKDLVLGPQAPANARQHWGVDIANLRLSNLTALGVGTTPAQKEQFNTQMFKISLSLPGAKVVAARHCKAIEFPEQKVAGEADAFNKVLQAFGPARNITIVARYGQSTRAQMLRVLGATLQSLKLPA